MNRFVQSWVTMTLLGCIASVVSAQTTEPTTEPTTSPTTLPTTEPTTFPTTNSTTEPTTFPTTAPTTQPTSQPATKPVVVPPPPPALSGIPEGTFLPDQVGRLIHSKDGRQIEFVFEKDGKEVEVPILSNLELMRLENAVAEDGWGVRFRASGRVTEYMGKNYLLIDHAIRADEPTATQPAENAGEAEKSSVR
jgi:hypothetical protein